MGKGGDVEVEKNSDIRLIGRALREGWDVPKEKVVDALLECIENRDPDLMLGAAGLLMKADELDLKRMALEQKQDDESGEQRLRLLELAQRSSASDLAKRAKQLGFIFCERILPRRFPSLLQAIARRCFCRSSTRQSTGATLLLPVRGARARLASRCTVPYI
jgi:hypothetical protein